MHPIHRFRIALIAPLALVVLPACVSADPPPAGPPPGQPGPGLCDPARAQSLVGGPRVTDEEARQRTGATLVRQIRPGDPVTMDFQESRVTVATDPATGRVTEARCG